MVLLNDDVAANTAAAATTTSTSTNPLCCINTSEIMTGTFDVGISPSVSVDPEEGGSRRYDDDDIVAVTVDEENHDDNLLVEDANSSSRRDIGVSNNDDEKGSKVRLPIKGDDEEEESDGETPGSDEDEDEDEEQRLQIQEKEKGDEKTREGDQNIPTRLKSSTRTPLLCCLCKFNLAFPRISAILFKIFIPLFLLIVFSCACGYGLAKLEAPAEYDSNDEFLAIQALQLGAVAEYLENFNLPLKCMESYLEQNWGYTITDNGFVVSTSNTNTSNNNSSNDNNITVAVSNELLAIQHIVEQSMSNFVILDEEGNQEVADSNTNTTTSEELFEELKRIFFQEIKESITDRLLFILYDAIEFLSECGENIGDIIHDVYKELVRHSTVVTTHRLTFTWIRCWDEDLFGQSVWAWTPSEEQLQATQQQPIYYEEVWTANQQELYARYLTEYPDDETGKLQAFNRSIIEATGRNGCEINLGGTAWFWFTIISTVGYGNQSPETSEGRILVVLAGTVFILLFGIVLAIAGQVTKALAEDFFFHFNLRGMNRPFVLSVLWGSLTCAWMICLGGIAHRWWDNRLPCINGICNNPTLKESWWFAYISITTVGLGDLFLQPQYLFIGDVFHFNWLFLIGFVLLSTFLSSVGQCLVGLARVDRFGERLRQANLVRMLSSVYMTDLASDNENDDEEGDEDISNDRISKLKVILREGDAKDSPRVGEDLNSPPESQLRQLIKEARLARAILDRTRERTKGLLYNDPTLFRDVNIYEMRKEQIFLKKMSERINSELNILELEENEKQKNPTLTSSSSTTDGEFSKRQGQKKPFHFP